MVSSRFHSAVRAPELMTCRTLECDDRSENPSGLQLALRDSASIDGTELFNGRRDRVLSIFPRTSRQHDDLLFQLVGLACHAFALPGRGARVCNGKWQTLDRQHFSSCAIADVPAALTKLSQGIFFDDTFTWSRLLQAFSSNYHTGLFFHPILFPILDTAECE